MLLTDGIEPLDAVPYAVERRVRVFPGGGPGGFRRFLVADAPTLQAVAEQTGGTYHNAEDAEQREGVFADLPRGVATQRQNARSRGGSPLSAPSSRRLRSQRRCAGAPTRSPG